MTDATLDTENETLGAFLRKALANRSFLIGLAITLVIAGDGASLLRLDALRRHPASRSPTG